MRSINFILQILILFAFVCHSYILLTPVIDELGFIRVGLHVLLVSVCWLLLLVARDINKRDNKDNNNKNFKQEKKGESNEH